jgi:hypothetical protein
MGDRPDIGTAMIGRVLGRIGRRGSALLFFALVDAVYGWGLHTLPPVYAKSPAFSFYLRVLPLDAWAWWWAVTGLVCLVGAFAKNDWFAFAFAMLIKFAWGVVSLLAWIDDKVYFGYATAAIWLAFAGFVLVVAGWPEQPSVADTRPRVEP